MNQSDQINELAAALSKAQAEMKGAVKESSNPFFKSKYADLESVWDACRKPLTSNGLSVIQTTGLVDGQLCVVTTLAHNSGQWIRGVLPINVERPDPQKVGSAISYARRYALAALVGIYQTDDDAESAMERQAPAPAPIKPAPSVLSTGVSEAQIKRLFAIAKTAGVSNEQVKVYARDKFNLESSRDMNRTQYDELVKAVESGELK